MRIRAAQGRALRGVSIAAGLLLAISVITLPLNAAQQGLLTLLGIAVFLVVNRFRSRAASLVLIALSGMVTLRYLFWRATETLEFEGFLQTLLGTGLVCAELYAAILLFLSYFQGAWPLGRKPVPLPPNPEEWPEVDVYVPTYNEDLEIVRPTVLACMQMDYPQDKLKVWILDDGRRPEFRAFAEEAGCGYIIRPDNKGAKAGNLNHAMRHTSGKYIAIFDCDHAPTRAFLQMTLGWLERDSRIAMVQTPHYFHSPDPFERNLARGRPVPNEGLLFYGLIQDGNDTWNAAFFCGSCAVIRREALEEVGGVPHETVTEDCHCSFRMQSKGWHTAYLRLPLASGLATERLAIHIGQRMRWARGMIQIMRQENTPFARALRVTQRLCYFTASYSYLFALPRVVFLTSPLAFLFFGQSVIAASPLAIVAYAGGHLFHAVATSARLNGPNRHSFWSEIYETAIAIQLLPVTVVTLLDPKRGKFNVTDKGGMLDEGYLDFRVVWPTITLFLLVFAGFCVGVVGSLTTTMGTLEFQAYLLNTIWAGLCLIPLSASIAVGREREQSRRRARSPAVLPARLSMPDGTEVAAQTVDLSLSGSRLTIERPLGVAEGDAIRASFHAGGEWVTVPARIVSWEGSVAFLEFTPSGLADEAAIVRVFFGRPDAWLHWDKWPADRPLRALGMVVGATADAVFRRYRFALSKAPKRVPDAPAAAKGPVRVSDVLPPRRAVATTAAALALLLAGAAPALSQVRFPPSSAPAQLPPALAPLPPPLLAPSPAPLELPPASGREIRLTLRELGQQGPMQLRGTADLQGVLFGIRADEVVTEGRLSLSGAVSPSLLPSLSQLAITLNEQPVGQITPDPARPAFGPLDFPLDPVAFTELNRLNFRFTGRYAVECNDPLSGLLWATVSERTTMTLRVERLPPQRDLARLPEPLFDPRDLRSALRLPVVLAESAGPQALRAAAIATSWFAVQAGYRGARFPVEREIPARGDAILFAVGAEAWPELSLPRLEGPTLAVVANPNDSFGTLLVVAGRSEAEAAQAATGLAVARAGLSGPLATLGDVRPAPRLPYDAPLWLPPDRAVPVGELLPAERLQASGYQPGPIRVPLRTAPDLYTWRNRGIPLELAWRAPPGPVVDTGSSRFDVLVSGNYLRSFPLGEWERSAWWDWLMRQAGANADVRRGRMAIPTYSLLGREDLELRFDMRPMNRGDCVAVPGDIRAALDPTSRVDLSGAYRFARLPNLGFFASAGFPFTRMADLSETTAILPDRPNAVETGAFLDLVGGLAAHVGLAATGLQVVGPGGVQAAAGRDLLVFGTLGRQPALATLLADTPMQMQGNRLSVALPPMLQDVRALLSDAPSSTERNRATAHLSSIGEGMGALIGARSPLSSSRSVVAVTGATPAAMGEVVSALLDPARVAQIQGDLSVFSGTGIAAFRTGATYGVGDLPWWLVPQAWMQGRFERLAIALVAAAFLLGLPWYWIMRRKAASRLRARTPKEPR
ncbi:UDP-forming cellulose synthase catalytic subunit [Sabulicella glaciei]|uniref:Cellulose synthase catalytic subunit [UDP-forming] n=1 Tax=Sabulicella glaciei TaxID=2984948 RepID=A0ABT3NU42_9PROT|nr:UDP-forming cellulose synthase catalytic subunit [Roseococcus sp. MDT2-1-1]MCW8085679.1 UDP-forming cellulose synthase catalytic subunit [Roseococcus sp. MDT2-1-1]